MYRKENKTPYSIPKNFPLIIKSSLYSPNILPILINIIYSTL